MKANEEQKSKAGKHEPRRQHLTEKDKAWIRDLITNRIKEYLTLHKVH